MGQAQEISEAFLAAAVEPERWIDALARLAAYSGSDHAQIIGIGPDFSLGFNWVSDMDAAAHAAANRAELVTPQSNYRVAAGVTAPANAIIWEDRYDAVKPHLLDDAYLDLCSDLRIPFGCQTNLLAGEVGLVGMALLRSNRSGPTTGEARALFARVRAAAASAAALQVALEREGHRLVAGSFEAMGTACFVLDRTMAVRALTLAAEALLHGGALTLHDGHLALPDAAADRRLGETMAALRDGRLLSGNLAIADPAGLLTLKLHRLPVREWNMAFAPYAILIAKHPGAADARDSGFLRDAYGLTATEAEIALLLRAGKPRDAICVARGITRETLRSHLRSLFAKLGVSRETEAIHLLHALLS